MIVFIILLTVLFVLPARTSKMEPYVIGGRDVKIQKYPHSLYLFMECGVPEVCGGSILNQHVLLTAAHCLEDCVKAGIITAYAGHENLDQMTDTRSISAFYMHERYSVNFTHPDIALGYTEKPWKLNMLKRVLLSRTYHPVKKATVAGWGVVNDKTREIHKILKAVTQYIQPANICKKASSKILPGMMCAMNARNYPSYGDSGSALVLSNGLQLGITSWRSIWNKALLVYVNVTFFYDWIRDRSKKLHCKKN